MSVVTGTAAPRGRIDKRQAILDAAFTVFAQRGYTQAGMQEIADVAGTAKPTVYSHFHDKETLFLAALGAAGDDLAALNLAIIDDMRADDMRTSGGDIAAEFERTAFRLAELCCEERSRALRRLTYAEVHRFPSLLEIVYGRTAGQLTAALAGQLARLSLAGRLRHCDPDTAAGQFLALVTGPMESRSRLGTREVSQAEACVVASAAVDTFLRAYGAPSSPAAG
jgi:AcrR family transcriptional regulator